MTLPEDSELLRDYAERRDERAFAELVRRHLDRVYAVALRQVGGDAHLAEDVSQRVFADLARKAAELARRPVLGGWLYRSTQFTATDVVRAERRRRVREQKADAMQKLMDDTGEAVDWEKMRPVLDRAMAELNEEDRDAVWLRYFEGRSFAEVGARLRLAENSARMRVDRALDKLNAVLAKRGVTSTTVALAAILGAQGVAAAPAGLAASVTGVALAGGGATAGTGALLTFMGTMKIQAGVAGAIVLAGGAGLVLQSQANAARRDEIAALARRVSAEAPALKDQREQNQRLVAAGAEVELLRKDDAEFARLRDEVAAVKTRQQEAARVEADAKARRAAELAAMPVYSEGQLDVQPKPRFQGRPGYPAGLRKSGTEGEALLSYIVNADGKVDDVLVESYSHPDFADAAVAAVKDWRFEPGKKAGDAVNVRMQMPMKFTISTAPSTKQQDAKRFWF